MCDMNSEAGSLLATLNINADCLSLRKVNGSTLSAYRSAVGEFATFCSDQCRDPQTVFDFDNCLADFGNHLYSISPLRGQRQLLINCVMGIELLNPHLKGSLKRSRAVYAGWDKIHPSSSPPPIPAALIALQAMTLRACGLGEVGLALLLAFHGLLRISELGRLLWHDVLLPGDIRLPESTARNSGGLLIRVAKTGVLQFVPLTDPTLLRLLAQAKLEQSASDNVLKLSVAETRRLFDWSLAESGCAQLGFVLHSLRHGGATHLYMKGYEVATIQVTGRWKQVKTCQRYVQAGRGLLLSTNFSPRTLRNMAKAERRLEGLQEF